jgi:hypothetical protein
MISAVRTDLEQSYSPDPEGLWSWGENTKDLALATRLVRNFDIAPKVVA